MLREFVTDGFLTPYQEEVLVDKRPDLFLHWACGSGKTLAALVWMTKGAPDEKVVVVTRAPTTAQWAREAQKYTTLRPEVLKGQTLREKLGRSPDRADAVAYMLIGCERKRATLGEWVEAGSF